MMGRVGLWHSKQKSREGDMVQEGVSRNRDTHTDFQADASDHRDGTV